MSTFINQQDFKSLTVGDKLYGHGKTFEILVPNCEDSGNHPMHQISLDADGELYLYHDGTDIRYFDKSNSEINESIVTDLIDDGNCRIIKKNQDQPYKQEKIGLIGTGKWYHFPSGGLFGNRKK